MIGYCSDWSIKDGIVSGRALKMAVLVKEKTEIFSSFLSGLSSKDEGLLVINYLIDNQIFFDPSFITDADVDDETYTKLDKSAVVETLNINTDLNLLYITQETLKKRALVEVLVSAIKECEREIKVVLEPTDDDILNLFSPLSPIILKEGMEDDEIVNLLSTL